MTSNQIILIVEDDPMILKSLAYLMQFEGYQVETAKNGLEALEKLRRGLHPSLILLDLTMPVMDGTEFLREMHHDPELPKFPVVVLSGDLYAHLKTQEYSEVEENIIKPVDIDKIVEIARRYC